MEDLIQEQLTYAGEACSATDDILKMDGCRLTSHSNVEEEEVLFKLFDTPCFPRGDLTTITGPAKSGKTYAVSMLMACCVKRHVLAFERISEKPLKMLWLDTEQSRMTTKRILTERIGRMIGHTDDTDNNPGTAISTEFPDEQFYVLNVRGLMPEERADMLQLAIKTYKPDMVVIDGIADLMGDINSGPDSTTLMQRLLGLASTHECNITTIIHLNRSGERLNLRGWIGTVMVQKSYEVVNCEKVSGTQTFSASLTFSRRYHLEQALYYEIDDEGLPYATEKPISQPRDNQGKWIGKLQRETGQMPQEKAQSFNQKYIVRHEYLDSWQWDLNRLFADGMDSRAVVGRDELKQRVMTLANIHVPKYYDKLFQMALDQHLIKTTMDRSGRVVVIMP